MGSSSYISYEYYSDALTLQIVSPSGGVRICDE